MAEKGSGSNDVIASLEDMFKKAPHIPAGGREFLVKILPILALIFGVLGVVAGIIALGASPLALLGGIQSSMIVMLSGIAAIASSVLLLLSYPKINKRLYSGWVLLFWAEVINIFSAVLALSVGSILGMIIGFYLLFEIKGYYKK